MLNVSYFDLDLARSAEYFACLWQGDVPADLTLHKYLMLGTEAPPRRFLIVWEASSEAASSYMEGIFGQFGTLTTEPASADATEGLAAALARDLDRFGSFMRSRGDSEEAIARGMDVRRRGLEAPDQESAAAAGRAWAQEG